jgi:hypothetical protein
LTESGWQGNCRVETLEAVNGVKAQMSQPDQTTFATANEAIPCQRFVSHQKCGFHQKSGFQTQNLSELISASQWQRASLHVGSAMALSVRPFVQQLSSFVSPY